MKIKELIFATGLGIATLSGCDPTPKVESPITSVQSQLDEYRIAVKKAMAAWTAGESDVGNTYYRQVKILQIEALKDDSSLSSDMVDIWVEVLFTYNEIDRMLIQEYADLFVEENKKEFKKKY